MVHRLSRRSTLKVLGGVAGLAVAAPIVSTIGVVAIDKRQAATNHDYAGRNYRAVTRPAPREMVVYYSRFGNTELMALEIAGIRRAAAVRLRDDAYPLGLSGWANALRMAGASTSGSLEEYTNVSSYETIYIGGPIWLYSPAPPVWEFVRRSDLTGKRVVLFNSLNSTFDQKYVDQFGDFVRRRGGELVAHLYVVRGRMTRQLNTIDFLALVRQRLGEVVP